MTGKETNKNKNRIISNIMLVVNAKVFDNIFQFICMIPIFLLCIIGCSDVPYTGQVLTEVIPTRKGGINRKTR